MSTATLGPDLAIPAHAHRTRPPSRRPTPQRAIVKRVETPPAVVDEAIKSQVTRARDMIGQGMMAIIEAGRLLAEAKAMTSQKSTAKTSTIKWTDYLDMVGMPRQTAEDAINFAERDDRCKSEEKRQKALIAPSRNKAMAELGHKPKPRNRGTTNRHQSADLSPTQTLQHASNEVRHVESVITRAGALVDWQELGLLADELREALDALDMRINQHTTTERVRKVISK